MVKAREMPFFTWIHTALSTFDFHVPWTPVQATYFSYLPITLPLTLTLLPVVSVRLPRKWWFGFPFPKRDLVSWLSCSVDNIIKCFKMLLSEWYVSHLQMHEYITLVLTRCGVRWYFLCCFISLKRNTGCGLLKVTSCSLWSGLYSCVSWMPWGKERGLAARGAPVLSIRIPCKSSPEKNDFRY